MQSMTYASPVAVALGMGLLTKQLRDGFGFHQLTRLIQVVVDNRRWVDPERVIHRGNQLDRMNRIAHRCGTRLIGLAMHESATYSGTRDAGGVAIRPVIAAVIGIAVARCAHATLRAASKLADRDNQRVVEHSALIQV